MVNFFVKNKDWGRGRGGLIERGGLLKLSSSEKGGLIRRGGLLERGGLIEDLRYVNYITLFPGNVSLCHLCCTSVYRSLGTIRASLIN